MVRYTFLIRNYFSFLPGVTLLTNFAKSRLKTATKLIVFLTDFYINLI